MSLLIDMLLATYIRMKYKGVRIGKKTHVSPKSIFEGNSFIDSNTMFYGELGYASYIGSNCFITGRIGRYSSIGNDVVFVNGNHPTNKFVSTSPMFYRERNKKWQTYVDANYFQEHKWVDKEKKYSVEVGNDVWIGSNVRILDGISIGDGAIVAAGAVVTKDVEPYSIIGGVPAKVIRKRYSEEIVKLLISYKWWDRDEKWIKDNVMLFHDIEQFVEYIYKENKERE